MARPILLATCVRACTAAEARYRIDAQILPGRGVCVIALDATASDVTRRVAAAECWSTAQFYSVDGRGDDCIADLRLRTLAGEEIRLSAVLPAVDAVVMVASTEEGAAAAAAIGEAAGQRGVMTAGLIVGNAGTAGSAVSALRPHARVMLVPADEQDLAGMLSALRA